MHQKAQHLSRLLDPEKFNELVLEGLQRLLDIAKERAFLASQPVSPGEKIATRTFDGYFLLLGDDTRTRSKTSEQFDDIRSILTALALPSNYPDFDVHISDAFSEIGSVVAYREQAAKTSAPAQNTSLSQSSTRTRTNEAASQHEISTVSAVRLPQSISPFIELMVRVATDLGDQVRHMTKREVEECITTRWDSDVLGELTAHKLQSMATFTRWPEAQRGRA